ncbi:MAG TPA: hypothetical protein VFU49_10445 [Ktedonobacteraceae bacterium]|nr:hypothetical protein [Ktedonobacteraceae bacterium]
MREPPDLLSERVLQMLAAARTSPIRAKMPSSRRYFACDEICSTWRDESNEATKRTMMKP